MEGPQKCGEPREKKYDRSVLTQAVGADLRIEV
jgi:hypothetical protein